MAKSSAPAGDSPASETTDLTAILARLDALEAHVADLKGLLKDGEALDEITKHIAAHKEALGGHSTKLDELAKTVASHGEIIASDTARLLDGDLTAERVEGYDAQGELMKAFRQIEAIANHSNIQLPG